MHSKRILIPAFVSGLVSAFVASCALAGDAKPAVATAPKVTYDDDVRPILREHCFTCHNQSTAKSGLVLDSYAKVMAGGSSGDVVVAGDLDGSRLWALASHAEMPYMPPMQDKLPDAKLSVIRRWIEGGALENSGSKAAIKAKPSFALATNGLAGKPSGPAAMPEHLWRQPVVYTPRLGAVTALATSPWAPLAAVAGQREVVLYNTDSLEELGVLPFPEGIPYCLRFSRNGSLLLVGGGRGGQSGCAVAFDVKTGRRLLKVGDELDAVLACDINNDQSLIALGGPQKIVRIYSTQTLEQVAEIKKHTDWIYAVEFSPDGVLLATADRSAGLFVWEAATAREYLNLQGHKAAITAVSWRDDSNVLASASEDGNIKLFEMQDGREIKNIGAHGGGALWVSYAHDGRLVSAGRDLVPKLWDPGGNPVKNLPSFPEPVMHAVFTHDAARVIAADWSGQVRVYNTADGAELGTLAANPPTLDMLVEQAAGQAATAKTASDQANAALAAMEKRLQDNAAAAKAAAELSHAAAQQAQQTDAERQSAAKTSGAMAVAAKDAAARYDHAKAEKAKDLAAIQSDLDQVLAKKTDADRLLAEKTAAAQRAQAAVAPAKVNAEKLAADIGLLEKQVAALKEASGHAAAKAASARSAADQAVSEKAAFEKMPAQLAAAIEETERKVPPLEAQAAAVENRRIAAAKIAEQRKADAKQFAEKLEAVKTQFQQTVARQLDAEKLVAAKSQAIQEALQQLAAMNAANSSADQLASAQAKIAQLVAAREAAAKDASEKLATTKTLVAQLQAAQGEYANRLAAQAEAEKQLAAESQAARQAQAAVTAAKDAVERASADKLAFDAAYRSKP